MATLTVTEREVSWHGKFKKEVGYFTEDGTGGPHDLITKLGTIYFFRLRCINNSDNIVELYLNATTASASETIPGTVHFEGGLDATPGIYSYYAIGMG